MAIRITLRGGTGTGAQGQHVFVFVSPDTLDDRSRYLCTGHCLMWHCRFLQRVMVPDGVQRGVA